MVKIMEKANISCSTPRCKELKRQNQVYHILKSYDFCPQGKFQCIACGGFADETGKTWFHICYLCHKSVEPGALTGLFVPSRCVDCQRKLEEKDRQANNRCLKCGILRINCCC